MSVEAGGGYTSHTAPCIDEATPPSATPECAGGLLEMDTFTACCTGTWAGSGCKTFQSVETAKERARPTILAHCTFCQPYEPNVNQPPRSSCFPGINPGGNNYSTHRGAGDWPHGGGGMHTAHTGGWWYIKLGYAHSPYCSGTGHRDTNCDVMLWVR